jgi:hypothetical protein
MLPAGAVRLGRPPGGVRLGCPPAVGRLGRSSGRARTASSGRRPSDVIFPKDVRCDNPVEGAGAGSRRGACRSAEGHA